MAWLASDQMLETDRHYRRRRLQRYSHHTAARPARNASDYRQLGVAP
jgi:hypothetical protein